MNYIVLDMEWNQSYPRSGEDGSKRKIRNEIIEIGAVKLDAGMNCVATYKRLIKPVFVKRLNSHVKKITGITSKMLESGGFFPDVIREFREWCGSDRSIITWGYDDVPMLLGCLRMYGLDTDWVGSWYNLQVIFNSQTDGSKNQRSLKSAMEHFGLSMDEEHPWHDALNDAAYTAMICQRLDLAEGIKSYSAPEIGRKNADTAVFMGLKPIAVSEHIYHRTDSGKLRCHDAFNLLPCPVCGNLMARGQWVNIPRRRQANVANCKKHGKFIVVVRTVEYRDKTVASRAICECTPEAEKAYRSRLPVRESK